MQIGGRDRSTCCAAWRCHACLSPAGHTVLHVHHLDLDLGCRTLPVWGEVSSWERPVRAQCWPTGSSRRQHHAGPGGCRRAPSRRGGRHSRSRGTWPRQAGVRRGRWSRGRRCRHAASCGIAASGSWPADTARRGTARRRPTCSPVTAAHHPPPARHSPARRCQLLKHSKLTHIS